MGPPGCRAIAAALLLSAGAASADPAFDQLTFHGNRQRTGWNSVESVLTPAAVSGSGFGKLWDSPAFDKVVVGGVTYAPHMYASPLYVDDLAISGGTYAGQRFRVVIAATSNGFVYAVNAFQAGSVPAGTILWRTNLGPPSPGPDSVPVGVIATPIADLSTSPPRLYLTSDTSSPTRSWRVYALDLGSGAVLSGWPLALNDATVTPLNVNGPAAFQPTERMSQRAALNLSPDGSVLYLPFGSYTDGGGGWMVAVDTGRASGTPRIASSFSGGPFADPSANAGMWGDGGASIGPGGIVYVTTGNGPSGPLDRYWGQSLLAFAPTLPLSLVATYTPWNHCQLDDFDVDLGSGAPMLLPDLDPSRTSTPHLIALGGKQGNLYLLDRENLPGGLARRPDCNRSNPMAAPADGSLFGPDLRSYYGNTRGPLNVFGPYSENYNHVDLAKSRTTPAYFRAADGTSYLFFSGSTKTCVSCTEPQTPGFARVKVVTSSGQPAFLTIDAYQNTLALRNPGSPIVTSNGSSNPVVWVMDTNIDRSGPLTATTAAHPTLYAIDGLTLRVLFASTSSQLQVGGKYYHPIAARGVLFIGTDRLAAFGLSSSVPPPPPPPPPPTGQLFFDDFMRATGLGPDWRILSGAWLTSTRAESDAHPSNQAAVQGLSCADCSVSAQVVNFGAAVAELDLRQQPSNDRYDVALLADGTLQVRRHNGTSITVLGQAPSGIADLSTWATISLSATGANPVRLVASVNGTAKIIVNDSSASGIVGSGTAGMWTDIAGVIFRSFTVNGTSGGGSDGGTPDAGPPDAGPPDAGPPESGPPDAGPPDGGPPVVIFSDAFNRTTGLGSSWRILSGAWLTSTRAESDAHPSNQAAVQGLSCADCSVSAQVVNFGAAVAELDLRQQPSNDRYDVALLASGTLQIRRHNGTSITVLGQSPSGIADLSNRATISLSVTGANPVRLVASVNGTAKVSVSDSSASAIAAPGTAGMWTDLAGVIFDDFTVTTNGASGGGGSPDGGTPDAGPPDAGPPDAGPPDAGPPAVIFSDAFNRTTGLGSSWRIMSGAWLTSTRAESDAHPSNQAAVQNLSCAECSVSAQVVNFGAAVAELDLRQQPSGDRYDVALLANGTLQIRRHDGTSITVLGSAPSGIADLTTWATISLSATGVNPVRLVASVNGVAKITASDSSASAIAGAGTAGIWTDVAGVIFDDFTVTSR
jgi:hypothetical protein